MRRWRTPSTKRRPISNGRRRNLVIPKNDARYVLYLTRGILYFTQQEWDKAASDFREAQALKPDQYNAYLNLAHTWIAKGDFSQADAEFAKALQLHPPVEVVASYHLEQARNLLHDGSKPAARSLEALRRGAGADATIPTRTRHSWPGPAGTGAFR